MMHYLCVKKSAPDEHTLFRAYKLLLYLAVGGALCLALLHTVSHFSQDVRLETCTSSSGKEMPATITLFTTFKDRTERLAPHKYVIQNWAALRPRVHPVLFATSTEGELAKLALQHGWDVLGVPGVNHLGTPFIKGMYLKVYEKYDTDFYAFANGDLLFGPSLLHTLSAIKVFLTKHKNSISMSLGLPFIIGRRTDFNLDTLEDAETNVWQPNLVHKLAWKDPASSYANFGLDYFITTKWGYPWTRVPDLVIGRAAFDEYLLLMARYWNMTTIDITPTHRVLHLLKSHDQMTHYTDQNPDSEYNRQILDAIYPYGLPWESAHSTSTQAFTIHDEHYDSIIMVCIKKHYSGVEQEPYFKIYKYVHYFNDSYVIKPSQKEI